MADSALELEKAAAAARAVDEVRDDMLVGLGSGSTSAYVVRRLGECVAEGLRITATATSHATETLARSLHIPLRPFAELSAVDVTIDGVDEIDPQLRAIKGGGGAHVREKIVAAASVRMIAVADSSKPVAVLGAKFPLPLEVLPFASAYVQRVLRERGLPLTQRVGRDGAPVVSDQGNWLFDMRTGPIESPETLAAELAEIPGVIGHGLFLTEIDLAIIARGEQVDVIAR